MRNSHADLISLSGGNNHPVATIDLDSFDLDTLGGRVAFLRLAKGWTGAQLARECGFSQNTIWSLENNKVADPSARLLWALAKALETTPEYLWAGKYDPDEAALIAAFRLLPAEQRPAVLRAAGVTDVTPDRGENRKKH